MDLRNVETIKPDHGTLAFMPMIMPGPRWGEDQVSRIHVGTFAINGREGAFTFDNEPQGRLGVSVGRCNLTRQNQLKSCIKRICSFCFPTKCRIFKDQHPSLGFFGTDDLSGFEEKGADVLITPEMRDCSGDR